MASLSERRGAILSAPERAVNWLHRLGLLAFGCASSLAWRVSLYRSRRDLAELSDAQLLDIGLTRHEAAAEARRGFDWR